MVELLFDVGYSPRTIHPYPPPPNISLPEWNPIPPNLPHRRRKGMPTQLPLFGPWSPPLSLSHVIKYPNDCLIYFNKLFKIIYEMVMLTSVLGHYLINKAFLKE